MPAASLATLRALYADDPDPWRFRTSDYERAKFEATVAAMPRPRYGTILEVGCGNGELGRRLASCCDRYIGIDAVPEALTEARRAVPGGTFACRFLPAPLPDADLVVVSEVLYFLDARGIGALAAQWRAATPAPDLLSVNWLGDSGHALDGPRALETLRAALSPTHRSRVVSATRHYRIDVLQPYGDA
ncbi:MAG: trans-aconitate 2-methyltransferase [Lautropia sp.]